MWASLSRFRERGGEWGDNGREVNLFLVAQKKPLHAHYTSYTIDILILINKGTLTRTVGLIVLIFEVSSRKGKLI